MGRDTVMGKLGMMVPAALLLAACGQTSSTPPKAARSAAGSPSASPSAKDDPLLAQPWLLRFDAYVGEDGETKRTTYVSVVPSTGKTQVATLPKVPVTEVTSEGRVLLVDAGHRWAVPDTRPIQADRSAGRVTLRDLAHAGRARVVDVRRAAKQPTLTTDWVSFDPARPGILRVVSGSAVWTVDVAAGTATREGSLPRHRDWIYTGGFDRISGKPYIEATDAFDTIPAGNGDDKVRPLQRSGGTLLDTSGDEAYPGMPDPGCETSAGFQTASGGAVAFCVVGRRIEVHTIDGPSGTWMSSGVTTDAVVPGQTDPIFALPPAATS